MREQTYIPEDKKNPLSSAGFYVEPTRKNIFNLNVKSYDTYLGRKLEASVIKDKNGAPIIPVTFSPVELAFRYAMKRTNALGNTMRLPMINYYRLNGFSLSDMNHRVLSTNKKSRYVSFIDNDGKEVMRDVQILTADLKYQIDVISDTEETAYQLMQELLFLFYKESYVILPQYKARDSELVDQDFRFDIVVDNQVEDNSSLESETDAGKLYRLTMTLTIDDAALVRDVPIYLIETVHVSQGYLNSEESSSYDPIK